MEVHFATSPSEAVLGSPSAGLQRPLDRMEGVAKPIRRHSGHPDHHPPMDSDANVRILKPHNNSNNNNNVTLSVHEAPSVYLEINNYKNHHGAKSTWTEATDCCNSLTKILDGNEEGWGMPQGEGRRRMRKIMIQGSGIISMVDAPPLPKYVKIKVAI